MPRPASPPRHPDQNPSRRNTKNCGRSSATAIPKVSEQLGAHNMILSKYLMCTGQGSEEFSGQSAPLPVPVVAGGKSVRSLFAYSGVRTSFVG